MIKLCLKCMEELPLDMFSIKRVKKDGSSSYHAYCKKCQNTISREHYNSNKEDYSIKAKSARSKRKEWLKDYKKNLSCVICEESTPECLDFHHSNPDEKYRGISDMISYDSIDRIAAEIDKCAVLCANCHRKLHAGLLSI